MLHSHSWLWAGARTAQQEKAHRQETPHRQEEAHRQETPHRQEEEHRQETPHRQEEEHRQECLCYMRALDQGQSPDWEARPAFKGLFSM